MRKYIIIICFLFALTSFKTHKFYTAIFQIEFVPKKEMLQVISRIFIDDLNEALEKKYHKRTYIASEKETTADVDLLKKYLSEKFSIKINGLSKSMNFINKEIEDNVLICYLSMKDVSKISTLEIENTLIMEAHGEQQNIIQANFNGEKHSLLFTSDNYKGVMK